MEDLHPKNVKKIRKFCVFADDFYSGIEIENLISVLILGMLFFITIIITLFVENGVVEKRKYIYTAPVYIPCQNADQFRRNKEIRDMAKRLAVTIEKNCPDSSDKFISLTSLEQAVYSANVAIVRNE